MPQSGVERIILPLRRVVRLDGQNVQILVRPPERERNANISLQPPRRAHVSAGRVSRQTLPLRSLLQLNREGRRRGPLPCAAPVGTLSSERVSAGWLAGRRPGGTRTARKRPRPPAPGAPRGASARAASRSAAGSCTGWRRLQQPPPGCSGRDITARRERRRRNGLAAAVGPALGSPRAGQPLRRAPGAGMRGRPPVPRLRDHLLPNVRLGPVGHALEVVRHPERVHLRRVSGSRGRWSTL